jgi:hypothetical protein
VLRPDARALTLTLVLAACSGGGDDDTTPPVIEPFACPASNGHADPLGSAAAEARAGRATAAMLPAVPSGMITWREGDFILANDRVALVIEDVGDSDLYDPWGGRPVGLARVAGGAMIEPNNFGEVFVLTGRATVLTECVTVLADGSDGGPAIVRAQGRLHPLPFINEIQVVQLLFRDPWDDIHAAIDYELAPGAEEVVVRMRYGSNRDTADEEGNLVHAVMYTKRTPMYLPGKGFTDAVSNDAYLALVDDAATSWAYVNGDGVLGPGISVSGFVGSTNPGFTMPAHDTLERVHARLIIGGPGLDGIAAAAARVLGETQREITGVVTRGGAPAPGVRVHAVAPTGPGYFTRTTTDATGAFTLHVPAGETVRLDAFRRGDALASAMHAPSDGPAAIDVAAGGTVRVVVTEPGGAPLPARVQLLPAGGQAVPEVAEHYGEPGRFGGGRLAVAFALAGDVTLPVPAGMWEVVTSRGYEYEVDRQTITVTAGAMIQVDATLDRTVATPGELCGDFHIHTDRSNDSADPGEYKLASAVADGVELPVRSDHEYVADFSAEIAALGVEQWAAGFGSVELTSMELWGHMGVFPLVPDPARVNAGAPTWQTFPTAADPDRELAYQEPPVVFDAVRARPEAPVVIINHPTGGMNYFEYVGFDPATGLADNTAAWDTQFTLVEVFNDEAWDEAGDRVAGWFAINNSGRRVFAVGSSDSHGITGSPVGYPRTCIAVGTDDPRAVTAATVRDRMAAGHHTVSGGIYVTARVGGSGPGDTATGLGPTADVAVEVQAATWVDVDALDVVVDGVVTDTIPIMPEDADPTNPVVRWRQTIQVPVRASGGGYVVIAAHGDAPLEPVHPGRLPFGVTNPIFLMP